MNIARKIKETQYKMNLRKVLGKASFEELQIMLEEVRKEMINRRKQK